MADPRTFELDELTNRPGTYFNPQTEVLIVVDDSPDLDHEVFDTEDLESTDWVLISEESPIDENRRDELIESFQLTHHPGAERSLDHDLDELDEDELEPDEELEEDQGLTRE
ncbi:MAG TPA: hypothetical protein VGX16_02900 [Solirubrobacteraceae bacterium]|jgi:hypothetical protein|nr:hypothetical protein [Solirubrobacteraceae bacterium]